MSSLNKLKRVLKDIFMFTSNPTKAESVEFLPSNNSLISRWFGVVSCIILSISVVSAGFVERVDMSFISSGNNENENDFKVLRREHCRSKGLCWIVSGSNSIGKDDLILLMSCELEGHGNLRLILCNNC